jgi:upstream activation factor subunit UAF30
MAPKKSSARKAPAKRAGAAKKTARKSASKSTARKSTAKSTARKSAAKSTARKSTAKSTGRKSAAKSTGRKSTAKSTARKSTARGGAKRKPNAAFMKPMQPSEELAAVIGNRAMPRTEVTKKIWDYIHKNGLQDAKNRRQINADDRLRPVFGGRRQVSMFEMTRLVNDHLENT